MNKIYPIVLTSIIVGFFSTGCAEKNNRVCGGESSIYGQKYQNNNLLSGSEHKAYQFKIKPIVGSRQDDAKVVVDMGKVLKIWVAPYKIKGTMIASHDIYSWMQKPDFIVGESIPNPHDRNGIISPLSNVPFSFKPKELESTSLPLSSKEVKEYVNDVYKKQNEPELVEKANNKADNNFDSTIRDYLESKAE